MVGRASAQLDCEESARVVRQRHPLCHARSSSPSSAQLIRARAVDVVPLIEILGSLEPDRRDEPHLLISKGSRATATSKKAKAGGGAKSLLFCPDICPGAVAPSLSRFGFA